MVYTIIMTKKFVRKLQRVGSYSYSLNVPKELADRLNWRERQKLEISFSDRDRGVLIKDWKDK